MTSAKWPAPSLFVFSRSRDQTSFPALKETRLCNCLSGPFQISRTIDQYARKLAKLARQVHKLGTVGIVGSADVTGTV